MNSKLYLLFPFVFAFFNGSAQISHGGYPLGLSGEQLDPMVSVLNLPEVDNAQHVERVRSVNKVNKDLEFAVERLVEVSTANNGQWSILPNGDRLWRMNIYSPNAHSLSVNFNKFLIPEGGEVFIYNPANGYYIGSFDHTNSSNVEMGTAPILGDQIVIEYREPKSKLGQGLLDAYSVAHDFIDLFKQMKGFGDSGNCNINVACDLGDGWEKPISSVALITTSGGTRVCTGAMIGNTRMDDTPYFLTANHCLGGSSTSWVFVFNYQSDVCSPGNNGPLNQTVSGCQIRANHANSDFALLELNSVPPANYNVWYAGWDKSGIAPEWEIGIHHPSGDIKKISKDYDPVNTSGNYWRVADWDEGTTEGGSSGSPLFDTNQRIIGQLYGGWAACGNDEWDEYGKISASWNGTDSTVRLHDWLDPDDVGYDSINTYNPHNTSVIERVEVGVDVYPNPSQGGNLIVTSDSELQNVEVYDLHGKLIEPRLRRLSPTRYELQITGVSGMYFVRVYTHQGVVSRPVLLQK